MSDRNRADARCCVVFYLCFGVAFFLPALALAWAPALGLGAAIASVVAWLRWGPPAIPGLVPGLMWMALLTNGLIVCAVAVVRLMGW